uniref:Resolvase/invertase-type recombinase catalytic domain-containing protein n=1 Tax=Raoultella ornithinolytica TaxID=54291 RepID=A0A7R7ED55_RAOOR|nr:hypothetical protein [Raoultella ornithinolytica]
MALIGYARVSTAEQDTALQTDALRNAGCERVFEDTASGAKADRPGLADALAYLRDGDVLVVWRLDRLGRSLPHLIETVGKLEARGVGFRSLTENIDTTTPGGRLIFHVFGALGGTVAKLAMRQPFVLFKGLTFQKLCLPGAFRPGDHHNKMLRPGLCVMHASPQYL